MNAHIISYVCVISTLGEWPFMAWVPLVFIGAWKYSGNYNRYLEISIILLHVDLPWSVAARVHIAKITLLNRVFSLSYFFLGIGQTEGFCSFPG